MKILFFLIFTHGFAFFDLPLSEPRIECTVLEVLSPVRIPSLNRFPQKYQSLFNDNIESRLFVGGRELTDTNPSLVEKNSDLERIQIPYGQHILELKIYGRPISRQGHVLIDGAMVAKITCH